MNRLLKAANSKQHWNTVKTKFGMNIPCDHKEAMIFYADNVSTNWKDDELLEIKQIYNFSPFYYIGPVTNARIPPSHTKIWEYGHITWEPLSVMIRDDLIYLAKYVSDNDLLYNPGWKQIH